MTECKEFNVPPVPMPEECEEVIKLIRETITTRQAFILLRLWMQASEMTWDQNGDNG